MGKYIITSTAGDTYNIRTYDVVTCETEDLVSMLDCNYFGWRTNKNIKVFEVSKELDKQELQEAE